MRHCLGKALEQCDAKRENVRISTLHLALSDCIKSEQPTERNF